MRCINDSEEVRKPNVGGICGEIVRIEVRRDRVDRDMGQGRFWCRAPVEKTSISSMAQILGNTFERGVMDACRCGGELGKDVDGESDVNTRSDVREHQFTEKATISEPKLCGKGISFLGTFRGSNGVIKSNITVRR